MRIKQYITKLDDNRMPYLVKEKGFNYPEKIDSPYSLSIFLNTIYDVGELAEENVYLLCANAKNRILGLFEISHGATDYTLMPIREIFQKALLCGSTHIFLAHNHPSGDTKPSSEDIRATKRVKEAGEIINVKLADHVIVGDSGRYTSLKEDGYI